MRPVSLWFKLKILSMRKFLSIVAGTMISASVLAGGLVTNNNQSAYFTRMQNRNASTGIDAVYFNPAGLTKLGNGFFASVNNQTIFQTQTVTDNYEYLSGTPRTYVGDVKAPVYPGVYVVYNTGKLSFSAGFNPVGGGGGAEYKSGLPSFEEQVADIPPSLRAAGIPTTQYTSDIYFKGSSVYFGFQGNVAYKISDMFSVAVGARLVSAKNTAQGHLTNIMINPTYPAFGAAYNGSMVSAPAFFTAGATTLGTLAAGANSYSTGLSGIIAAGSGGVTAATLLTDIPGAVLTPTQIGTIQAIITAAGYNPTGMNAGTAQAILSGAAPVFTAKGNLMAENAAKTQDVYVDAQMTGMGVTPILSVNFTPAENFNISLKYEFKTKLELKTKVIDNKNGGGIYIQDSTAIADIPAILSVGAQFKPTENLTLAGTFNYYFDKSVDYDGQSDVNIKMIDKNFLEFGLGAEYGINDKLRISAGWVATVTGVNKQNYNNDLSYSANTNTIGAGFGYRITPAIDLNIGGQYTFYATPTNTLTRLKSYQQTYAKKTWLVGVGLDFYFGKE
jgi:long-chain fatty acid transport protein